MPPRGSPGVEIERWRGNVLGIAVHFSIDRMAYLAGGRGRREATPPQLRRGAARGSAGDVVGGVEGGGCSARDVAAPATRRGRTSRPLRRGHPGPCPLRLPGSAIGRSEASPGARFPAGARRTPQ